MIIAFQMKPGRGLVQWFGSESGGEFVGKIVLYKINFIFIVEHMQFLFYDCFWLFFLLLCMAREMDKRVKGLLKEKLSRCCHIGWIR